MLALHGLRCCDFTIAVLWVFVLVCVRIHELYMYTYVYINIIYFYVYACIYLLDACAAWVGVLWFRDCHSVSVCVGMCVCMCIYIYMYVYVYTYYMCIYVYKRMFWLGACALCVGVLWLRDCCIVSICVCMCIYIYHMKTHMFIHMLTCIYMLYTCMRMYLFIDLALRFVGSELVISWLPLFECLCMYVYVHVLYLYVRMFMHI